MHSLISWFARNGVVANLLMFVILVVGATTIPGIKKEVFPEMSTDMISVQVPYRGAAPEEVEEGVCIRIEEAVQDLDGVKKITSNANEGSGSVQIEVELGYDPREMLSDIKSRVDAIDTFPAETEQPVIQEITTRMQVINLSISGQADELTLKRLGERVREDLLELGTITQAELFNARPYEISIEVSEDALRRHNLTFDFVANAVRRSSLDLPGGSLRTAGGEILLRTKGQAYRGREFEELTLLTGPDGSRLTLSDVARVVDGFEQTDNMAFLDGEPAVMVQVFRVGDQSAIEISDAVYGYIDRTQPTLPEGIHLTAWQDQAKVLKARMNLLLRNGATGLVLVFVVLALFLRMRLAFWVTLGIPISFLGCLAVMPLVDVSINMMSLFTFILVLGIVVDDAIVVGESIFSEQKKRREGLEAAINGAKRVAMPVTFGVLTTMVAFMPMWFVPGFMGKMFRGIPWVVIPTLLFSLIESQWILPHHLSHYREPGKKATNLVARAWNGFFDFFSHGLEAFIERVYKPALKFAVEWRYLTAALALSALIVTVGMVAGGRIKVIFMPYVESDNLVADLTMPQETPAEVTREVMRQIEAAGLEALAEVERETGQRVYKHVLTSIGEQPFKVQASRFNGSLDAAVSKSFQGEVNVELLPSEARPLAASEIARRWRQKIPAIPDVVELTVTSDMLNNGEAINIQFAGRDMAQIQAVVAQTKTKLGQYPGVVDISDSFRGGKPEIKLDITSKAESLGLTLEDLGRQVRQGFFGEEAQRIQRGRDDIRVMVRYPEDRRTSLGDLEQMRVRTPDGGEVPFSTVARAEMGRGFASIRRVDRRRTISVTAEVDEAQANPGEVLADLEANFLPELLATHPGVSYTLEGQQRSQAESMGALSKGFAVALFVIYAMMAIPFGSYIQPAIVMSAVPFGIVGAIWGHAAMGLPISLLSMFGVVALAGVSVNDSLVLVDFINRENRGRGSLKDAVIRAGTSRFRPILLTSLTTAAGVTPLILEKEVQAQFLIPMAVSLAAGVLFATVITLALVPAIYLILEDILNFFRWLGGRPVTGHDETSEETSEPELVERRAAARERLDPGALGLAEGEGIGAD